LHYILDISFSALIYRIYGLNGLKFEEETSEMLHLERGFVLCRNLNASCSRSETPGKFWHVVLEKDGEDQLDG
jgi:hypothetical protein